MPKMPPYAPKSAVSPEFLLFVPSINLMGVRQVWGQLNGMCAWLSKGRGNWQKKG